MSRSNWKPFFIHPQVIINFNSAEINTFNRSTSITQSRIGRKFQVYNGLRWFLIEISSEMVGSSLGQYAPTRKRPIHKKITKK
jgi:ribosomal protein S19